MSAPPVFKLFLPFLSNSHSLLDVSPTVFKRLDDGYERNKIRLSMYNEDCKCLIITVPTFVHEELGLTLYRELLFQIYRMGLERRWNCKGHTTFYNARRSSVSGGAKQADASGGPREGHPAPTFPTLVVEAGYSQTLADMRGKARAWFKDSDHNVKIAVLAKIIPAQRTLLVERWEERQHGEFGSVPGCQQRITITGSWANPSVYQVVESSDLILSFRLLFLREPRQGEADVIISTDWMKEYAKNVWDTWDLTNEASGKWSEGRCSVLLS
ncbi:uncharacterized protein TRIVIDRAFT_147366 [Trichoderma virens Gv29-8]|uniref:Uncharacterized protein n=1 Tax=Hypocrea virens (strain Gv29-8 / FGSC 10586) TaxID=413071 RepID=G9MP21_HYPVG|nr:uncharacterized protein TRIVIDRAFT_147366 [Trichoderma virens Gv29-8]EHK23623.1 hypothetical protein TRIVIDRAFT_147366 [Trichoderma virens Gv29-8]